MHIQLSSEGRAGEGNETDKCFSVEYGMRREEGVGEVVEPEGFGRWKERKSLLVQIEE